jgi:hypothetical protein
LLDLDGEAFVVDLEGKYWAYFRAWRVPPSEGRSHGLRYSLTLHGPEGSRLVGFDNAHPVSSTAGSGRRRRARHDHRHRYGETRPHDYKDAATLVRDFWAEVETVLHERGVIF